MKNQYISFSFLTLTLLVFIMFSTFMCSNRKLIIKTNTADSGNSILKEYIIGKTIMIDSIDPERQIILEINKENTFSFNSVLNGCIYRKLIGNWILEDSILILEHKDDIHCICLSIFPDDKRKQNTWEKANGITRLRIVQATDSAIYFTSACKTNETIFKYKRVK